MIKTVAIIEVKIGDNTYSLECSPNSPLGEVHDALMQMRSTVVAIMQSQVDQEQKKEEKEDA